jgi:hypothetical protein
MLPSTVLFGSSSGSCDRKPMEIPSAGKASPPKSLSSPAMMRSSVLLPAPLAPRTPILAPGKNASQMSSRTFLSGGWTFDRPFIVKMY